jgi:glycosyltransferase involved in cell wall biosynthesis
VLFWTHGFKGVDKGLKRVVRSLYFKLADGLLLYGNHSKKVMIEKGFNEKKLFVIFNSLDTNQQLRLLANSKASLITDEKSKIFKNEGLFTTIFIGRLVKGKKIEFLLNAVKELSQKGQPINCIIIGDGPEKESIMNFISTNRLEENFLLTGKLHNESDICKYFRMSNLMVSPGNVGLNCMHSFAYGIPVLTHNNFKFQNPEVEAIVPEETGLLYEYDNYNDLLLKLQQWMNVKFTKVEIKAKCHEVLLDRYNPVSHAKKIIEAIDSF